MTTYRESGVDIDAGDEFVRRITPKVRATYRPEVIGGLGGFGGLFRFPADRYQDPVLVSGTDGVGTKLKVAIMMRRHDTIGIDLVAMCVNDICVSGAEPLFFLDYVATGGLEVAQAEAIIDGIVSGCQEAGCALIGGETAEMPSCYPKGEYDLAGFAVGVVERAHLLDGRRIAVGDYLLGVPSSGLHSNGYTLARKVLFETQSLTVDSILPGLGRTVGEELLQPTKIYVKALRPILNQGLVHGLAHITGGGLSGNLPRILPEECQAVIRRSAWPVPPLFLNLQRLGDISEEEMFRVFNMGIGFVLVVGKAGVEEVTRLLEDGGETPYVIGEITERPPTGPALRYVT